MNVIQAALRGKYSFSEKVELLKIYGSNPGVVSTCLLRGENAQTRQSLDYELGKLIRTPGLPKWAPAPVVPPQDHPAIKVAPPPRKTVPEMPPEIEELYRKRAKAINAREKAGRKLTQQADQLSKADRADLVAEQKSQHRRVAWSTNIIQHWQETGEVNMTPTPDEEAEVISDDEKRWKALQTLVPRAKRSGDTEKYQALLAEKESLRKVLGKTKRKG